MRSRDVHLLAAALLLVSACATVGAQAPATPRATSPSPTPPECPAVEQGGYKIQLSVYSGPAGSSVTATGPIPLFAKDGSYSGPDGQIQFWWNADPQRWHSLLPGRDPVAAGP
ncbi:MAG TPA: hypothetical protein VG408_00645, partial [Actinomycetota bacterium]|nr:hypothetical protein [Actinomycetota bacterium]